ncbi:MAG: biopolymer transport protein ExbD [Verrucomicrobia bacterium]|jgi:biopolymer transport protein ExbD|nr:MAG: biopolymer transport protein ExbD [Verrucomicrobiota bacterium]
MAGGGGGEGDPEFQIAPMIDVLLVLLIFFMSITSAQVLKVDKNISLPLSDNAAKKDNARAEAIVNVRWESATNRAVYTYDDKVYEEMPPLSTALAEAKRRSDRAKIASGGPEFRVVIRGDREASVGSVTRVMSAAAEAGIADVSFSTTNKE